MSVNPVWVAGYGGTPTGGAALVWIASYRDPIAGAVQRWIAGYGEPVAGATPVWVAGYGPTPPAGVGAATIVWIGGVGSDGGTVVGSTWSAADAAASGMTLSNGGLTVTPSGAAGWQTIRTTISKASGKWYVEMKTSASSAASVIFGMGDSSIPLNNYVGLGSTNGFGVDNIGNLAQGMNVANTIINYTATFTIAINAVIAFAGDFTSGKVWMAVNNVWFGGGNPATGVNPMVSLAGPSLGVSYFPAMSFNGPNSGVWTLQSTAASQTYTPPSGFTAWDS